MSETHTLGTEAGATVDQGTCAHGQSDDDTCPECIREVVAACGFSDGRHWEYYEDRKTQDEIVYIQGSDSTGITYRPKYPIYQSRGYRRNLKD